MLTRIKTFLHRKAWQKQYTWAHTLPHTTPLSFLSVKNFNYTLKNSENWNYWNGKIHISDCNIHLLFCFQLQFLKRSTPSLLNPIFSFKKDFKGKLFTDILCSQLHSPRKETANYFKRPQEDVFSWTLASGTLASLPLESPNVLTWLLHTSAQHKPLTCSTACAIPSVTTLLISSFSFGLAFYFFFLLE